MTTNNGVNSPLSGTTGTGNFVGSNSPSLTTPKVITGINDTNGNQLIGVTATGSAVNSVQLVNAATANNPSMSATGSDSNITLLLKGKGTGGAAVLGTSTNDNATAGYVGEIIDSTILVGSAVSLTSGVSADITSISLTAGDYDIWGIITSNPNAATTSLNYNAWINTTSATPPTLPNAGAYAVFNGVAVSAGGIMSIPTGTRRLSLSTTTTVYLSTNIQFAINTMSVYGYIGARRVR